MRTDELRAALANGVIPPNAPVWQRGWTEWKSASEVPELMSHALAAKNGVVPNIPPPPLFVVAAQSAYEGQPIQHTDPEGEPPPPPRYVPASVRIPVAPPSTAPAPPATPTAPAAASAAAAAAASRAAAAKDAARNAISKKTVMGIAPPGASGLSASEQLKRAMPSTVPAIPTEPTTAVNVGTRARPEALATVVGVPAIAPPAAAVPAPAPAAAPAAAGRRAGADGSAAPGSLKRQTLILYGGAPTAEAPPPSASSAATAPPIVVPAPGAQPGKNAVTQAPPWGEGAVGIGPEIPKSAPTPRVTADSVEELSGSMLLESDAGGDTVGVKRMDPPPPNAPANKPRSIPPPVPRKATERPPPFVANAFLPGQPGPTSTMIGMPAADAPNTLRAGSSGSAQGTNADCDGNERSAPTIPPAASVRSREGGIDGTPRVTSASISDVGEPAPFPWLEPAFTKFPVLRRLQKGRPKFFIPVVGGLGAFTSLVLFGVLVKACTGALFGDDSDRPVATTTRPTSSTPPLLTGATGTTNTAAVATASTVVTPPPAVNLGPCALGAAGPKSIAPRALVPSGVEVVAAGNTIAAGFATAPKEGQVTVVDASTLAAGPSVRIKGSEPLRRVMPLVSEGKAPQGSGDADRKNDRITGRRAVAGSPPIDIGVADGNLVWAPHGSDKVTTLWALPGEGNAEALRAVSLDGVKGYAFAFRRSGAIWIGVATTDGKALTAKGELTGVAGLGPQVGSPAIAASGDQVLVVWADRASASDAWGLRSQRTKIGEAPEAARAFNPPAGGLGAPFMSPGVTSLGGGRFLVVWTEGAVSSHQVRAQTLDAKGAQQGDALLISADGVNAGQGQAAIGTDGRGIVAYLASSGKTFEVVATPISCPR